MNGECTSGSESNLSVLTYPYCRQPRHQHTQLSSTTSMDLDAITAAMTAVSVPTECAPVDTSGSNSEPDGRAQGTSAIDLIDLNMEVPNITGNHPKTLVLDIGGRKFKVSRDTLQAESGLFRHQLSGRFPWEPEMDGSYFLDADPDLFEHLLRFMRRPEVLPLFYDAAKGFDYDLYNRLVAESQYFQIDALHEWIKNKVCRILCVDVFRANICVEIPQRYQSPNLRREHSRRPRDRPRIFSRE